MNQTNLKYCDNINNIYLYDTHDQQAQGIISIDDKFIVPGMPVPKEIMVYDDEIEKINLNNYIVLSALEGSLIRVFSDNEKWIISTNKRLNAFQSCWGSNKSFGKIFLEKINETDPRIFSMLDKNKVYIFFLKTDKFTKIVCNQTEEESLVIFGTYEKINNDEPTVQMPNIIYDDAKIINFKTIYDARIYINSSIENNITRQGLILFSLDSSNPHIIKILDPKYKFLFDIRDNNPSIHSRLLELILMSDNFYLEKFINIMYPERSQEFKLLYENLLKMIKYISSAYVKRHLMYEPDVWISPSILHHFVENIHQYISQNNIQLPEDTKIIYPLIIEIFKKKYNSREILNMIKKFSY